MEFRNLKIPEVTSKLALENKVDEVEPSRKQV